MSIFFYLYVSKFSTKNGKFLIDLPFQFLIIHPPLLYSIHKTM